MERYFPFLHIDDLKSALPITVVAAVILFALKEALEFFRRRGSDARKRRAFRIMLAQECERNHWTQKRLLQTIDAVEEDINDDNRADYVIERRGSGDPVFKRNPGQYNHASWPLPDVHIEIMDKIMLDVASLDRRLFEKMRNAYDSVLEMKHVRESLINFIESDDERDKLHMASFPDYAKSELTEVFGDLEQLHFACTRKKLTAHRLR